MAMQEGIGRGGYRMLALVFLAIGLLGLVSSLYAFIHPSLFFFNALGFVLAFVALMAMFGLTLLTLRRHDASNEARDALGFNGSLVELPDAQPVSNPDYEFNDEPVQESTPAPESLQPAPAPIPVALSGMSPRAPRQFSPVPEPERSAAFHRLPPPEHWAPPEQPRATPIAPPLRRAPSGMTMGEKRAMERAMRAGAPVESEESDAPGPTVAISVKPSFKVVPTVLAKVAPADGAAVAEGTMRGKCSQCQTMLLGPKNRPINLRCPHCDKITLLK